MQPKLQANRQLAILQGLLDLEGDSLTPILVSLVKKDAHMLDAFGKGASEDIRLAKQVRGCVTVALLCTYDPICSRNALKHVGSGV